MARLLILLFLCFSQAAIAGQRAIYRDPDGKPLNIDVADNGDAVVRAEGQDQYGIWKGGNFYLVAKQEGKWNVARVEDLAAAFDQVMPPMFKALFGAAASGQPATKLRIEPKGKRTVAGIEGQVYAVYGLDDQKPGEPSEFVMSKDPRMQPTGKVMEQFLVAIIVPLAPMIGEVAARMANDMRAIFSYGAPLSADGKFQLLSLETRDVPPASVALPAEPQSVEQLVAALKASATQPAPEPAPAQ